MKTNNGVSLGALALFVAGITMGGVHMLTGKPSEGVQPAEVYSVEILEVQKAVGLHTNYRQGSHNYLEVHYEGEWQTLKCSIKGWEQQGLYFRQNIAEVAEGCELEKLVRTE